MRTDRFVIDEVAWQPINSFQKSSKPFRKRKTFMVFVTIISWLDVKQVDLPEKT